MNTALGDTICPSTSTLNCGTVNGSQVCVTDKGLQSNGYPAAMVDGQVVADKSNVNGQVQNCVVNSAGNTICINPPQVSSSLCTGSYFTCLQTAPTTANPTPINIPLSKSITEVTKTATVTNTDGSKTVTATTTDNVENSTPNVTVTSFNSSGQSVSSSTTNGTAGNTGAGAGIGTGSGSGTGTGTSKTTCDPSTGAVCGSGTAATTTYNGSGRFYTSNGISAHDVGAAFLTKAANSPLLSAGKDIFNVTVPSGGGCSSCDFTIPAVMGMFSVSVLPFCGPFENFWSFVAAALKVVTVLMALRIMITPTF